MVLVLSVLFNWIFKSFLSEQDDTCHDDLKATYHEDLKATFWNGLATIHPGAICLLIFSGFNIKIIITYKIRDDWRRSAWRQFVD